MGGFLTPILNLLMLNGGGEPVVDYPNPSDVREGVEYKNGELVGTLVVGGGGGGYTLDQISDAVWSRDIGTYTGSSAGKNLLDKAKTSDIMEYEVAPGFTFENLIRDIATFQTGISTGGGTEELVFRDIAGDFDRIKMTVDTVNNRLLVERFTS